jgi:hypothetical protein
MVRRNPVRLSVNADTSGCHVTEQTDAVKSHCSNQSDGPNNKHERPGNFDNSLAAAEFGQSTLVPGPMRSLWSTYIISTEFSSKTLGIFQRERSY